MTDFQPPVVPSERDVSGLSQAELWSPPVVDGVEWKQVRDLKTGDRFHIYGGDALIVEIGEAVDEYRIRFESGELRWWPSDAFVPVKVKPRKWQRTVLETTTDERRLALWRKDAGKSMQGDNGAIWEYGEVVEL